jgi:hypothetical protein
MERSLNFLPSTSEVDNALIDVTFCPRTQRLPKTFTLRLVQKHRWWNVVNGALRSTQPFFATLWYLRFSSKLGATFTMVLPTTLSPKNYLVRLGVTLSNSMSSKKPPEPRRCISNPAVRGRTATANRSTPSCEMSSSTARTSLPEPVVQQELACRFQSVHLGALRILARWGRGSSFVPDAGWGGPIPWGLGALKSICQSWLGSSRWKRCVAAA